MTSGTTSVSFDPRPGPGPSAVQPSWIRAQPFPWRGVERSIASTHRHGNPLGHGRSPVGHRQALTLKLFVLDPHTIYRRGLAACLELMSEVDSVAHAGSVREAWEDPALLAADLVILDTAAPGGPEFIGAAREAAEA